MQEIELHLGIGDAIQIDETIYTVIDIEDGEVSFRIDFDEDVSEIMTGNRPAK